jgi:hypothetical protein
VRKWIEEIYSRDCSSSPIWSDSTAHADITPAVHLGKRQSCSEFLRSILRARIGGPKAGHHTARTSALNGREWPASRDWCPSVDWACLTNVIDVSAKRLGTGLVSRMSWGTVGPVQPVKTTGR